MRLIGNSMGFHLNGREYLENASKLFPKNSLFVIFSDNIYWCMKELKGLDLKMFFMPKQKHHLDFYLMSLCDHNIISNSSFSWWAAYINQNKDRIVVAPKKWYGPKNPHDTKDLIPEDWILDPDGKPTTDPNQLYGDPPGTILPMGGNQAYKGFGLSFMIEMLCGGLSGGMCAFPNPPPPTGNCAFFIVLSPARMAGLDHLTSQVSQLEEYVRNVPRIDGVRQIILPGDPERRMLAERRANGIPVDDGNWAALVDLAETLGVEPITA